MYSNRRRRTQQHQRYTAKESEIKLAASVCVYNNCGVILSHRPLHGLVHFSCKINTYTFYVILRLYQAFLCDVLRFVFVLRNKHTICRGVKGKVTHGKCTIKVFLKSTTN